jgi:hypothetical protein
MWLGFGAQRKSCARDSIFIVRPLSQHPNFDRVVGLRRRLSCRYQNAFAANAYLP